jgi:hypothetical protein
MGSLKEKVGGTIEIQVLEDVMVPMRDGIRLATDCYLPVGMQGRGLHRAPVILERTPYDKSGISRSEVSLARPEAATRPEIARRLAQHGYAVVMQDCRGRNNSEGVFRKYLDDAHDGYDTMAWLVRQPWSNGSIGTMGFSYGAHTQCAMATQTPPGLACMYIDSGGFSNAYHGGIRRDGAFEMKQVTWAMKHALKSAERSGDLERVQTLSAQDLHDWFRRLPWARGRSPLSASPEFEDYLFEQWQHGVFSDYWKQPGLYNEGFYDRFPDVPTAIVGSWLDPYVLSCLTNYGALSARRRSTVTLLMGPWTHGKRSATHAGDIDFGPQATLDGNIAVDYLQMRLDWFGRWLKGETPVAEEHRVRVFLMGGGDGARNEDGRLNHGGRWIQSDHWPCANVSEQVLRLAWLDGRGHLSEIAQTEGTHKEYRYDPRDPVPTIGGALTSGEPIMHGGMFDQRVTPDIFVVKQDPSSSRLAERPDVLVFEGDTLTADLAIVGAVEVDLFVSSDCPDTDFTVKLVDLHPPTPDYPEGYALNITDGILRMRYRDGWDREVMMRPDVVYPITVRMLATANLFKAGHRLRIDISSSNFPQFDINPNTGEPEGDWQNTRVATNRVHMGGLHLSKVRFPVLGFEVTQTVFVEPLSDA